jgi:hypothetical protein
MATVAEFRQTRTPAELRDQFDALAAEWKDQSKFLSSSHRMAMLRPYQRIIGMGPAVVPLILEDLRGEPNHWFWALEAITGECPLAPDTVGGFTAIDVRKTTEAWLEWGRQRGMV